MFSHRAVFCLLSLVWSCLWSSHLELVFCLLSGAVFSVLIWSCSSVFCQELSLVFSSGAVFRLLSGAVFGILRTIDCMSMGSSHPSLRSNIPELQHPGVSAPRSLSTPESQHPIVSAPCKSQHSGVPTLQSLITETPWNWVVSH